MCAGGEKVTKLWFLGPQSGWHGSDLNEGDPYVLNYKFTGAKGELVKAWLGCSLGEYYTEFTIGRGSIRHVCAWGGLQICAPVGTVKCLKRLAFPGVSVVSLIGCIAIKAATSRNATSLVPGSVRR